MPLLPTRLLASRALPWFGTRYCACADEPSRATAGPAMATARIQRAEGRRGRKLVVMVITSYRTARVTVHSILTTGPGERYLPKLLCHLSFIGCNESVKSGGRNDNGRAASMIKAGGGSNNPLASS